MKPMLQAALAALAVTLPMPAAADETSEAEIKRLALEAILENPEIVMEAVAILQEREDAAKAAAAAEVLSERRDLLERDPNAPVLGNPEGDVTVVEFFDYNCPYCKRVAPDVKALLKADGDVRVVYREWPILGEGSVFATRAALASRKQGKYNEFHWALMELAGRANEASVMKAARDLGLDTDRLRADMAAPEIDEHIRVSMELTRALGFTGTPSFVIGDALVPGLVPLEQLKTLVADARERD